MSNKLALAVKYAAISALIIAAAAAILPAAQTNTDTALALQGAFSSVAEQYKPLVVSITATKIYKQAVPQHEFFFGDPFEFFFNDEFSGQPNQKRRQPRQKYFERKMEGGGTGVVINAEGYVLTNYHVISGADDITVHFAEKDKGYEAEVIGKDPLTDIAVIKIKGREKFAAAKLGDSDALNVGDWVIAIGSPFGLEQTVTAGIVSAKRQSLDIEGKKYDNLIQTDAAINRGNSGGPLVNIKGEVIGINTAIYAPTGVFSGIGFAIPINRAQEILDDLLSKGKVTRGWLGVEIKPVDAAIARQFGIKETAGALVNKVVPGSAAEKGGIKRGDVITMYGGKPVAGVPELQRAVRTTEPGKTIPVTVVRGGKEISLSVKPAEMPDESSGSGERGKDPGKNASGKAEWEGIQVENLTSELSSRYGIPEGEKGAVVTGIDYEKAKTDLGLREGDLVKGINRDEVTGADTFVRAAKKIDLDDGVVLDIVREGNPIYITYSR